MILNKELTDKEKGILRREMYDISNSKFSRCFHPSQKCRRKAIKAHSVQNSKTLTLLAGENQNVYIIERAFDLDLQPPPQFKPKSRHLATTFTGLCNSHDSEIFKPIDTQDFNRNNVEHLFLIAYRSVMKELHSEMSCASKICGVYNIAVALGKVDPRTPDAMSDNCMSTTAQAYSFYRYKFHFDELFIKREFNSLQHEIFEIDSDIPSVAVSSVFSISDTILDPSGRLISPNIILNIFPLSATKTLAIFSSLPSHTSIFSQLINEIKATDLRNRNYLITKILLQYCENIVIGYEYFSLIGEDRKNAILNFFNANLLADKTDCNDLNIYLF